MESGAHMQDALDRHLTGAVHRGEVFMLGLALSEAAGVEGERAGVAKPLRKACLLTECAGSAGEGNGD
ncbi:hypothetical protein [Spirillospora sp. CA-294931]|uniref:hypothetical protein n=1 Tax=Spirillospora sp. CA-294931 TaxID=3240042 RepID=UPI003D94E668